MNKWTAELPFRYIRWAASGLRWFAVFHGHLKWIRLTEPPTSPLSSFRTSVRIWFERSVRTWSGWSDCRSCTPAGRAVTRCTSIWTVRWSSCCSRRFLALDPAARCPILSFSSEVWRKRNDALVVWCFRKWTTEIFGSNFRYLLLHSPVLEPDLHLGFVEAEALRDLDPSCPGQVLVRAELLL